MRWLAPVWFPIFGGRNFIAVVAVVLLLLGLIARPVLAQEQATPPIVELTLLEQLRAPEITNDAFNLRLIHLTRDELGELANQWLAITRANVKSAVDINIALSEAKEPVETQLRADLDTALRKRNRLLRKLNLITQEWLAKGGTPDEIALYKNYGSAVIRREIKTVDPKTVHKFVQDWLFSREGGVGIAIWLGTLIALLVIMYFVALFLSSAFRRSISKKSRISTLLRDFLSRAAYWIIFAIGAAFIFSAMGINMSPILAAFGGASFVIGFATQSTLSNFASGILLMFNRPFDVGDNIEIAGISGIVKNVNTVSTIVIGEDQQITIVPNKKVWDNVIVNKTARKQTKTEISSV